ncbi:MAG: M4 family metallopeptidase [Thermoleophilia bacterium]
MHDRPAIRPRPDGALPRSRDRRGGPRDARDISEAVRVERSAGAARGAIGAGTGAERTVYDSEQTPRQRVTEVRSEGGDPTGDVDADTAYDHAGIVRDYLREQLGRDSIDGAGMDFILNVHYGVRYGNAFWDGDEMTFGDGDGTVFGSFARSLDITAHEIFHGVTQFTNGLEYRAQPGALNEHFSDVFGTVITQLANGQTAHDADWLIGDEVMGPDLQGEAIRSMKAPGTAYDNEIMGTDPQPAHMDDYYTGLDDNQGVHINSGIPNRAFYLVATDIGTDRAALIWYHAFQALNRTASFADAAAALARSAGALTREGIAPVGATQSIRSAFREVGVVAA